MAHSVSIVSVVPSPYQRDLFGALFEQPEIDLRVYYLECESPDSPWPAVPLRKFESVLPGSSLTFKGARFHVNRAIPDLGDSDFIILNTFNSLAAQFAMRRSLRERKWIFWGEILRQQNRLWRRTLQEAMIAPLGRATAIVGIGREAELDYQRRFPGIRTYSIPYHCDLSEFFRVERTPAAGRPLTFLFCGQMIERKGVDILLRAFEELVVNGDDVRLLLVGREAALPEFLTNVSAETRRRISYEGFQPPERLPEYFARADVFVLPSRHDGWGVVVNQAIGAALPVITSRAARAGVELVRDGENGFIVQTGAWSALAESMRAFVRRPDLALQFGRRSREIGELMTPPRGAEKWVRVLNELAAS